MWLVRRFPPARTNQKLNEMCKLNETGFFLRFRFGDRKEILRDRLEEFERPFSIDVISGHYILRDRWRNLRDRFGPSKHLKKNTEREYQSWSLKPAMDVVLPSHQTKLT